MDGNGSFCPKNLGHICFQWVKFIRFFTWFSLFVYFLISAKQGKSRRSVLQTMNFCLIRCCRVWGTRRVTFALLRWQLFREYDMDLRWGRGTTGVCLITKIRNSWFHCCFVVGPGANVTLSCQARIRIRVQHVDDSQTWNLTSLHFDTCWCQPDVD